MWLWVGLGNPGKKYENTRHNAGAILLKNILSKKAQISFDKKLNAELCSFTVNAASFLQQDAQSKNPDEGENSNKHVCIFPLTFMNLSGDAVQKAMRQYKIQHQNMIVLHDELELPPLEIRYKFGGGHRGHNGLRDIIAKTGSADFHRIRIGIGRPENSAYSVADYVLSRMPAGDIPGNQCLVKILEQSNLPVI